MEIADAMGSVFGNSGAVRGEIVAAASEAGRPEVVAVLQSLPERRHIKLNDLSEELHDVPVGV